MKKKLYSHRWVTRLQDIHTWLIRTVPAVTVVIIYPVKGNGAGAIQAGKWFTLVIKLPLCRRFKMICVSAMKVPNHRKLTTRAPQPCFKHKYLLDKGTPRGRWTSTAETTPTLSRSSCSRHWQDIMTVHRLPATQNKHIKYNFKHIIPEAITIKLQVAGQVTTTSYLKLTNKC